MTQIVLISLNDITYIIIILYIFGFKCFIHFNSRHRIVFSINTFFLQCMVGSLFVFPVAQKKCALVATVPLTSNALRKYSNNCASFLR